ncbi:MAG TPA: tetraacyldisaccharide 4'-kinase [Microvirga sp.]|jgi:tetraacyldisaccharide 4'-kinase|nr:tetraacyldisaccharide 4'-kinase [Microvirga sp.]
MRAPAFWWSATPSPLALLLRPAALLYGAVAARRLGRDGGRASVPVMCIGNFTVGGAGKTPSALAVSRILKDLGEQPAFLSRGYGGRLAGPVRVGPEHGAAAVGDEPLLLARAAPVIVSRARPEGAAWAAASGASVIVMDDGLQNSSLRKDLTIAVVDGATGLGNRLALPAGPLRAPLGAQWPKVDAVLVIGEGSAGEAVAREAAGLEKPVLRGRLEPEPEAATRLTGRRVLAFAGIGRPEKFFETLKACGAIVEAERAFPDHHPFSTGDLAALRRDAGSRGLALVTTEKDAARIGARDLADAILALPVRLRLEDEAALRVLLEAALERARQSSGRG